MKRIVSACLIACMMIVNVSADYIDYEYTVPNVATHQKTELISHTINNELLDSFSGQHPRLILDSNKIAQLKISIHHEIADQWEMVKKTIDGYLETEPPEYYKSSNKEENWMRGEADKIQFFSFGYLMTGDEKYYEAARKWALKLCTYPTWGLKGTNYYNKDLACSHCLTNIGLFYDWCYSRIDERTKSILLNTIIERGTVMAGEGWWRGSFLQNHSWWAWSSMTVAGIAIMDEYPNAKKWFKKAVNGWDKVHWMLDNDGACHEGILYWRYGLNPYIIYNEISEKMFGIEYSYDEYDKNNWLYPVYMFFGNKDWTGKTAYLNFADAARQTSWMEIANGMLYYASKYQNGYARKFADDLTAFIQKNDAVYSWLSLVFSDNLPDAKPYDDLPTSHLFEGVGYAIARSDWSGSESIAAMRCGNVMGTEWLGKSSYNPGSSHVHADLNHILLFGSGEWLLRDDGYVTHSNISHSTLMVDGKGPFYATAIEQINVEPKMLSYKDCEDYTYFAGEAAPGYASEQQVEKFQRHVVFLKKINCLILIDDINTKTSKPLTLRFLPEQKSYLKQRDDSYVFTGSKAKMRIASLSSNRDEEIVPQIQTLNFGESLTFDINTNASQWQHSTAITWSNNENQPQVVYGGQSAKNPDLWEFNVAAYNISINIKTGEVVYTKPKYDINIKVDNIIIDDYATAPIKAESGMVLLPLRAIYETVGYSVMYNQQDNTVTLSNGSETKKMPLNTDGVSVIDGCAMLPLDTLENSLGAICQYDETSNIYNVRINNLGTDTALKSVMLDGVECDSIDNEKKQATVTASGKIDTLVATTVDIGATVSVSEESEHVYKIKVVSEDKKHTDEYTLNITRPVGIGNIPICDVWASSDDGNLPRYSIDGNIQTRWSGNGDGEYIVYELDGEYNIDEIIVSYANPTLRGSNAVMYVSDDGKEYTKVSDISSVIGEQMPKYVSLNNIKCKFVKIVGGGNTMNTWNTYFEVGFKGKRVNDGENREKN